MKFPSLKKENPLDAHSNSSVALWRRPIFIIWLTALAAHGLLLLNDGVYWDGWVIYTFHKFGDYGRLRQMFFEAGAPSVYYLHRLPGLTSHFVFAYKLLTFLSVGAAAQLVFQIAMASGWMSQRQSLLLALFALLFPAYQVSVELVMMPYQVCYFLFLLAVFLALRADDSHTAKTVARYLQHAGAIVAFMLSFVVASLLAFYLGFLWIIAARHRQRNAGMPRRQWLIQAARRYAVYWLLPLFFWQIKTRFFAPYGSMAGYNHFIIYWDNLDLLYKGYFSNAVWNQFFYALAGAMKQPVFWAALIIFVQQIYLRSRVQRWQIFENKLHPCLLLHFGLVLLVLSALPYVVVGRAPSVFGWETRHSLLIALPVAIMVVALIQMLAVNRENRFTLGGWTATAVLLFLLGLSTTHYYIEWQARWVKDRSVMLNLSRQANASRYSTYWIDDRYRLERQDEYRFYEWASAFRTLWGGETRLGLSWQQRGQVKPPEHVAYPQLYNVSNYQAKGKQVRVIIERGPGARETMSLSARYFFFRFLRPQRLDEFLSGVTMVKLEPVPPTAPVQ